MENKLFRLRFHHLENLIKGYSDNYRNLEEGLRGKQNRVIVNGVERTRYTEEDAILSRLFYGDISSNPDNAILIVDGIDERCEACSNYVSDKCSIYLLSELRLQDKRSKRIIMEYLKREDIFSGDKVKVYDLIAGFLI